MSMSNIEPIGRSQLIVLECEEHNSYARIHFQILAAWFTFFLTANLVAIGLVVNRDVGISRNYLIVVCLFFISQNVLAIIVCSVTRNHFEKTDLRIATLLENIDFQAEDRIVRSPLPRKFYSRVTALMTVTCLTVTSVWIALIALAPI